MFIFIISLKNNNSSLFAYIFFIFYGKVFLRRYYMKKSNFSKDEKKAIGIRIRNIRINLKKNMEQFGELFNEDKPIAQSIVSRWERGISIPSSGRLNQIAELGNVSVNYLLTGKSDIEIFSNSINQLFQSINNDTKKQLEILKDDKFTIEQSFFFSKAIELFYRYHEKEDILIKLANLFHYLTYLSDPEVISEMSDRNLENDTVDELKELMNLVLNQSNNNKE